MIITREFVRLARGRGMIGGCKVPVTMKADRRKDSFTESAAEWAVSASMTVDQVREDQPTNQSCNGDDHIGEERDEDGAHAQVTDRTAHIGCNFSLF